MKDDPEDASDHAVEVKKTSTSVATFRSPFDPAHGLEDGRKSWDWKSKYPDEARKLIGREAGIATAYVATFLLLTAFMAAVGTSPAKFQVLGMDLHVSPMLLLTFAAGGLGGTTFSIKWLMHSAATGKWHLDRFYWRVFVPLTGGVYSVVVLNLMAAGMLGGGGERQLDTGTSAALAFLIGYFSDGVSGLLSNVANAVFGTVEKK
jgi:hypothetical protein